MCGVVRVNTYYHTKMGMPNPLLSPLLAKFPTSIPIAALVQNNCKGILSGYLYKVDQVSVRLFGVICMFLTVSSHWAARIADYRSSGILLVTWCTANDDRGLVAPEQPRLRTHLPVLTST